MNRNSVFILLAMVLLLAISAGLALTLSRPDVAHAATARGQQADDESLYVCSMHPWETSHTPDSCTLCGMALSEVEDYEAGDPIPSEDELFVNPDSPMQVSVTRHDGWIPITDSPFYQPREQTEAGDGDMSGEMDHSGHDHAQGGDQESESGLWTCGMHPEVIQDEPGICPICQMDLTPLKKGSAGGGSEVSIDPVTLQNIGVVTVPATRTDLHRTIRSNGTVVVAEENETVVNARIGGWVEELYVQRTGDPVRKGQPLLAIYSPELLTAQEEFVLALRNAGTLRESGIDHVRKGGDELLQSARRRLELWNIPQSEIDRLEQTREVRRTLPLTSPTSGIVLEKNVVEGASVKPGMNLFRIADLGNVWVNAQVYEYELPWVDEGDEVTVTSPYDPGVQATGTVDYIYPTLDSKSRTANVRIELDNPGLKLKPEMYVDVRLHTDPRANVVAVPKSAVIRSGERDIVFVKKGEGLFEPREVHLGLETDDEFEITHNLEPGEPVVTSAQFLLDSEAKLQEAIQRRIQQRKAMGQSAENVDEGGAMSGHQH